MYLKDLLQYVATYGCVSKMVFFYNILMLIILISFFHYAAKYDLPLTVLYVITWALLDSGGSG
jgi:hypothetical protein